jgi:hypothetical protein
VQRWLNGVWRYSAAVVRGEEEPGRTVTTEAAAVKSSSWLMRLQLDDDGMEKRKGVNENLDSVPLQHCEAGEFCSFFSPLRYLNLQRMREM